jgi:hypothetical protein
LLRAGIREVRRANEILEAAGFFPAELVPGTSELVGLVAEHTDRRTADGLRWGVE